LSKLDYNQTLKYEPTT